MIEAIQQIINAKGSLDLLIYGIITFLVLAMGGWVIAKEFGGTPRRV